MEVLVVLLWIGCGVYCSAKAGEKGYSPGGWLVLGFLFGVFGVLAVSLLPNKKEDSQ